MYELSQIILWILWRLRPAMAVEANLIGIINNGFGMFADDEELAWLSAHSDNSARISAAFADSLAQLDLLIYLRACEIAGVPSRSNGFQPNFNAQGSRHSPETCWRIFRNLVHRFEDRERLAHLRAVRLKREASGCPLRLDAPHQATSPALRAREEKQLRSLIVQISSLSPKDWGRWIGASSRRDGGGSRERARGPPPSTHAEIRKHPPKAQLPGTPPHAPAGPPRRMDFPARFWSIPPTLRTTPKTDKRRA